MKTLFSFFVLLISSFSVYSEDMLDDQKVKRPDFFESRQEKALANMRSNIEAMNLPREKVTKGPGFGFLQEDETIKK